MDWARRTGELVGVLPGVCALPDVASTQHGRVAAAMLWCPDAVVVGRTAAQLTFWPGLPGSEVELAQVDHRAHAPGFVMSSRRVDPELVWQRGPLRLTTPAATALDLSAGHGGDPIDVALRSRQARLRDLWHAFELAPGRTGNRERRRLLLESRDEPWSAAERLAHIMLRAARIAGWRANHPVRTNGRQYFVDIAFPRLGLAIEIDGRAFHDDAESFESDRRRQNDLVAAGWIVLRFTWAMLRDEPDEVIARIRQWLR